VGGRVREAEERAGSGRLSTPGLARAGIQLFRMLPTTANKTVLLCTDLHAENVLAAEREPWLVIDPKPHLGDPTYDALHAMLNCGNRLEPTRLPLLDEWPSCSGSTRKRSCSGCSQLRTGVNPIGPSSHLSPGGSLRRSLAGPSVGSPQSYSAGSLHASSSHLYTR